MKITRTTPLVAAVVACLSLLGHADHAAGIMLTNTTIDITGTIYIPDRQVIEDFRTTTTVTIVVFSFDPFFNYDFDQDTPGIQPREETGNDFSGFGDVSEPLGIVDFGIYGVFTPYALLPDRVEVTFNTQPNEIVSQAAVSGSTSAPLGVSFFGVDTDGNPVTVDYNFSFADNPDGFFIYDSAFNQDGSASGLARIDSILTFGNEATITLIETNVAVTPEPASAAVLALGGVALIRRHNN